MADKKAAIVAHLRKKLHDRQEREKRMQRLQGRAFSLSLRIVAHKSSSKDDTIVAYSLVDRAAGKQLTGPDGKPAYLKTLDELEAVLDGV